MPRPVEYENLIRSRALEPVQATPGAVAGFLKNAANFLALSPAEMAAVIRAHQRRNDTSYRSPFPPLSKSDAATMVAILEKYLPIAQALTGTAPR